jgi:hypothetical protein
MVKVMENIVKPNITCPFCFNEERIMISEIWINKTRNFTMLEGKIDLNAPTEIIEGEPDKVECKCLRCKHEWTVRKAKSIKELVRISKR